MVLPATTVQSDTNVHGNGGNSTVLLQHVCATNAMEAMLIIIIKLPNQAVLY
jgi:hypothetical protein